MRGDAPHRLARAAGDEQLHLRVAEERVLVRIDQFELLAAQLRHEVLEPVGKGPPAVDEGLASALVGDRLDAYLRAAGDCI